MQFNNGKKRGFTLAEIVIALFIVAIIGMLVAPIISRQISKSDEYAYYMAFKSIEKMAAQIAILGDDEEASTTTSYSFKDYLVNKFQIKKVNSFIASIPQNFAKSEEFVFRSLFPKAFAASSNTIEGKRTIYEWDVDDLVHLWKAYNVCNGKKVKKGVKVDAVTGAETEVFYEKTDEEFSNCYGYTLTYTDPDTNAKVEKDEELLSTLLPSDVKEAFNDTYVETDRLNMIKSALISQRESADVLVDPVHFCNSTWALFFDLSSHQKGDSDYDSSYDSYQYVVNSNIQDYVEEPDSGDDEDDDDGSTGDEGNTGGGVPDEDVEYVDYETKQGSCSLVLKYTTSYSSTSQTVPEVKRPEYTDYHCSPAMGHYGKYNEGKPDNIVCECNEGSFLSANNDRVCCPFVSGKTSYAHRTSIPLGTVGAYNCVNCETDFDTVNNRCCPPNSRFNGSSCVCTTGYEMNADSTKCILKFCPEGYTIDEVERKCIKNPPMIRAQKFCEEIYKNWNVSNAQEVDYCKEAFTTTNSVGNHYNEDVYNAVLGDGDASTTMYSTNSKKGAFSNLAPHVVLSNGVKLWLLGDKAASIPGLSFNPTNATATQNMCVNLKKTTKESCTSSGGYFCGNAGDNNCYTLDSTSLGKMGDARNCCASPDNSDLAYEARRQGPLTVEADVRVVAISGFTILADINGERGTGTLWEDVFPFFIASNGRVYPGYPMDSVKAANTSNNELYSGGNSEKLLPTDVYYYETNEAGTARVKKVAFNSISYARAMCSARQISPNSPYCKNLGEKFYAGGSFKAQNGDMIEVKSGTGYIDWNTNTDPSLGEVSTNPCDHYKCFLSLRRKARLF